MSLTCGEGVRVVDVVFEPEAISELEVSKLSRDDTREGRTQHRTVLTVLGNSRRKHVDVVHVTTTGHVCVVVTCYYKSK